MGERENELVWRPIWTDGVRVFGVYAPKPQHISGKELSNVKNADWVVYVMTEKGDWRAFDRNIDEIELFEIYSTERDMKTIYVKPVATKAYKED